MSHGLLEILRYFLLALIWLFFIYAARMVIVEIRRGRVDAEPAEAGAGGQRQRSARRQPELRLRIREPRKRRGQTFDVDGEVTLGRSPGCVVSLEDDTFASSVHARIFPRDGELWLEDLGSTNGTLYNGERLQAPTSLRRGDQVKVGHTVLEITK